MLEELVHLALAEQADSLLDGLLACESVELDWRQDEHLEVHEHPPEGGRGSFPQGMCVGRRV